MCTTFKKMVANQVLFVYHYELTCYLQVVVGSKPWTSLHLQLVIQLLKVLPADFT